ncbi:rhomboid family intramembrane serine protease [Pontibacter diazotrophicus]|uniref:Rhomboid family intramembrane serine protease n=1 Tax=Pontibacter diazotrophicus TaxID=1400979 RepID=A0A3D8LFQ7_9BACT|nr:rhomboid family intramembrane serine protease [Pontibacter diazotrophicus]RDV16237.1 rhomboid family intramembrane serine protease [Pontibacter diazotrophicus]
MPTLLSERDTYDDLQDQEVHFGYSFLPGILFVALMALISLLSYLTNASLSWLGVLPRSFFGLIGVVTGPLIHSGLLHLLSNAFPLVLLSGFILFLHRRTAPRVILLIYVLSGILTWFIGRQAYHIGASGVVYGLAGFLLFKGFLQQNRSSMAVSLAVLFLYSGLFYGLFPNEEHVSWEGHIAGLIAGLVAAIVYSEGNKQPADQKPIEPGIVQRHMSNTMGAHYHYFGIHYAVREQKKQTITYTYILNAATGAANMPTKRAAVSSNKWKSGIKKHD